MASLVTLSRECALGERGTIILSLTASETQSWTAAVEGNVFDPIKSSAKQENQSCTFECLNSSRAFCDSFSQTLEMHCKSLPAEKAYSFQVDLHNIDSCYWPLVKNLTSRVVVSLGTRDAEGHETKQHYYTINTQASFLGLKSCRGVKSYLGSAAAQKVASQIKGSPGLH